MQPVADELGLDLGRFQLHDIADHSEAVRLSLRLIKQGQAELFFKGLVSTRTFLKGVLDKEFGFRTDRILSHISVFNVPGENRIMIISDAGVNVQPDLTRKAQILLNAVDLAHALEIPCPRVAMLSFIEEVTDPNIRSAFEGDAIAKMYRTGEIKDCIVEGPYSLDVALSPEAARIKGVKGEVAGRADVIVAHDIGMGNVLYKALLMWCNPVMAAVVMGARIPLIVTSRADTAQTKLNSVALAIMTHRHLQRNQGQT
jgi:phosphate butyryltransferase